MPICKKTRSQFAGFIILPEAAMSSGKQFVEGKYRHSQQSLTRTDAVFRWEIYIPTYENDMKTSII